VLKRNVRKRLIIIDIERTLRRHVLSEGRKNNLTNVGG
jgi:hypothetical protein